MKLFKCLFVLMLLSNVCFAEVYVLVDSSKNILSLSESNDTIAQEGQSIEQITGTIEELGLTLNPIYYNLKNKKFIRNNDKINQEIEDEALFKQQQERSLKIMQKALEQAEQALIDSGELEAE